MTRSRPAVSRATHCAFNTTPIAPAPPRTPDIATASPVTCTRQDEAPSVHTCWKTEPRPYTVTSTCSTAVTSDDLESSTGSAAVRDAANAMMNDHGGIPPTFVTAPVGDR